MQCNAALQYFENGGRKKKLSAVVAVIVVVVLSRAFCVCSVPFFFLLHRYLSKATIVDYKNQTNKKKINNYDVPRVSASHTVQVAVLLHLFFSSSWYRLLWKLNKETGVLKNDENRRILSFCFFFHAWLVKYWRHGWKDWQYPVEGIIIDIVQIKNKTVDPC